MKKEIPIFFSTDDNYIPFLDVAISSLIANAAKKYRYKIIILHTGLRKENVCKIMRNQTEYVDIQFVDIARGIEKIRARFKNVYHFSAAAYYRMFIAALFPSYDKVVYLDCDLVVLGDISKLYHTELGDCILGAAQDQFVQVTKEFKLYAEHAVGVNPVGYVNSGVLLMNLKAFRENKIEEKFVRLITEYDFDLLDPDQAYLNYLCGEKIYMLPIGWNKEPLPVAREIEKNIVHYALYKKPWQYDDVIDGEYFWQYAKKSPFYKEILRRRSSFSDTDRAKKELAASEILAHAMRIVNSNDTFLKRLCKD